MNKIKEQLEQKIGRRLSQHENVDYYLEVERIEDLVKAVLVARDMGIPVCVIGDANALKKSIAGLVIKNNCRKFDKISMRGNIKNQSVGVSEVLVQAESGTNMNQLVRFTIEEGLMGLEYQLGLPGTVGDALVANAGYKREKVRNALQAIRVLTDEGKTIMVLSDFDKHLEKDLLLSAIFQLIPAGKNALWERGKEALEYRNKR